MEILNLLSLITVVVNLGLGFLILAKGKTEKVNVIYFILSVAIAGWTFSNWQTYYSLDYKVIDIYGKFTYGFSVLIVPLFFTLSRYYPKKLLQKSAFVNLGVAASWVVGSFMIYASIFTDLIQVKPIIVEPHLATIQQGSAHPFFFAYYIFFVLWAFGILIQKLKRSSGIERQKIKLVIIGFTVAAVFGITGNLLLTTFLSSARGQAVASQVGPIFTIFLVATLAYSIVRYRFMDIRVALQRGTTRMLSFLIIFCLYLVGLLIARDALVARSNDLTAIIIVALVVAVTIEPLRKFVFRFVDKAFASHDEKLARTQKRVALLLQSQQSYDGLLAEIQSVFKEFAEVDEVEFIESNDPFFTKRRGTYEFLKSTGRLIIPEELPYRFVEDERFSIIAEEIKDTNLSCIMAIGQSSSFIGVLTLGPRKSKKAYSAQDITELKRLQMQFGLALFNARLYQQAVQRITK